MPKLISARDPKTVAMAEKATRWGPVRASGCWTHKDDGVLDVIEYGFLESRIALDLALDEELAPEPKRPVRRVK